jgi:hypothetical protein
MLGVVYSIEHRQDSTAWVTEYVLDVMAKHHFVEYLAPRHANERVIKSSCTGVRLHRRRERDNVRVGSTSASW